MKFIFFIITLFSIVIHAQNILNVKALDASRNCWYTEFEDTKMIQIADFGGFDPKTYKFHKDDIKSSISDAIQSQIQHKKLSISFKGKYEAYLFCSSSGHSLIINSHESSPSFVYKTQLGNLEEGEFALNDDAKAGFTLGSSIHTLTIKRKKNISSRRYLKLLKAYFPEAIASARFFPKSQSGKIRVLPNYYFKTKSIIEAIMRHKVLKHYTKYVELSPYQIFSGESGLLLEGDYGTF